MGRQSLDELRAALTNYYQAIEGSRGPGAPTLEQAVLELERFSQSPDPAFPAPLRHYLESRSYRKAREFLASV